MVVRLVIYSSPKLWLPVVWFQNMRIKLRIVDIHVLNQLQIIINYLILVSYLSVSLGKVWYSSLWYIYILIFERFWQLLDRLLYSFLPYSVPFSKLPVVSIDRSSCPKWNCFQSSDIPFISDTIFHPSFLAGKLLFFTNHTRNLLISLYLFQNQGLLKASYLLWTLWELTSHHR